jgi:lysophospholipase L1-like esterase
MIAQIAVGLACLALAGSLAACTAPGEGPASATDGAAADGSSSPKAPLSSSPATASVDGLIVFDGDSLTEGFMLAPSQSYPAQVMRQLPAGVRWENVAVSGQTWPQLLGDVSTEVDPLFSAENGFNIVVVWAAANDLAAGYSAQEIYANARMYCLARKQRGFKVVTCTMYPLQPEDYDQRYESLRLEYNRLLRSTWPQFADALVDIAADERIGDGSPPSRADYFIDIVHLNAVGYGVIAAAVLEVLRPLVTAQP